MKPRKILAALAALSLSWSTAFAQSGPTETPEIPSIIILEIQPMQPGEQGQMPLDPATLEMLLMQLLATLEAEGRLPQERQIIVPTSEPGVGI
jgi:hypothetical protein